MNFDKTFAYNASGSVVSAGMFRIFGTEVAELPLVATSAQCQRQVILIYIGDLITSFFNVFPNM